MKANHIPQTKRIQNRIWSLQLRLDVSRGPIGKGNPYWQCKKCGISDPQLSIDGKHYKNCPIQGLDKQIKYYQNLLNNIKYIETFLDLDRMFSK